MFKDVVRLTQNDEFYLVTDTEGNIGIICFWNPVEMTDPELLQKNKIDTEGNIVLNKRFKGSWPK